jgi:para-nitrobenzyl esterase
VPLLTGTARDETSIASTAVPGLDDMEPTAAIALLGRFFSHELDPLMDVYWRTRPDATALEQYLTLMTDQMRIGSVRIAERRVAASAAPTYMYRLDYPTPVNKMGATHTLDIGFVFDNTEKIPIYVAGPDVDALTDQMSGAWVAFARTGDPNHPALPHWPPYNLERRATMIFDVEPHVEDDPNGDERVGWDGWLAGM